jgi:hypothetical protein
METIEKMESLFALRERRIPDPNSYTPNVVGEPEIDNENNVTKLSENQNVTKFR